MRVLLILLLLCPLHDLIGQTQANLTMRPASQSGPTKVLISLYTLNIESIDNLQQTFTIDFVVRLKWQDSRLSGMASGMPLSQVWHPNVHIYNLRESETRLPETIRVLPGDTVQYSQRYFCQLTAFLDFRNFPFDRQTLPVTLLAFGYSPEEVEFEFEVAGSERGFSIQGWTVEPIGARVGVQQVSLFGGASEQIARPRFDYEFVAHRHLNYYWWKVVAPLALIMALSWAVFWIDPSQVGAQIGVSGTSILTLIAFLLRLESFLPPVSYLTQMDSFIFLSLALVFLAYVEALISTSFALQGEKEFAMRLDRWSRVIQPVAFLLIVVYFWVM